MTTLKITLNTEQAKALQEHASSKGKTLEQDLRDTWWGRVQALLKYREKLELAGSGKAVEFREYHPREDRTRAPKKPRITRKDKVLTKVVQETFKKPEPKHLPEVRILPDDDPETACIKAEKIAERDGYVTEAAILKKFGRDSKGRKVK